MVTASITPAPPLELKVIVYVAGGVTFPVQWAYTVASAVNTVSAVIFSPPSAAVYQPSKV
jgi:hypothetical protein